MINELKILETDSKVVKTLKSKLIECNGCAEVFLLNNNSYFNIKLSKDMNGVNIYSQNNADIFQGKVIYWNIFESIVNKANLLGGKMYKGDSASQKSALIGSESLPVDTIDGYVSTNFYNKKIGDKTMRRSTYLAGVLHWANIATNHRSNGDGKGGYITINSNFRE